MNIDGLPNTTEIDTKVVAGWDSWAALTRDGHVVASGSNSQGLCSPPGGSSGGVDIAASASSFVALKADGTLVRWGDVGTPYTALPTGKVAAIAGGEVHFLAAVADGTVSAWYADNSGSQATVPAGLTGVVAVAAGDAHSLAAGVDQRRGQHRGWQLVEPANRGRRVSRHALVCRLIRRHGDVRRLAVPRLFGRRAQAHGRRGLERRQDGIP